VARSAPGIWPVSLGGDEFTMDYFEAAVIRHEAAMFYSWVPSAVVSRGLVDSRFSIDRVTFPEWNLKCEKERSDPWFELCETCISNDIAVDVTASLMKDVGLGAYKDSGCDFRSTILWKESRDTVQRHYPEASAFLDLMTLRNDIIQQLLGSIHYDPLLAEVFPKVGERRKYVVCDWIRTNKDVWESWVSKSVVTAPRDGTPVCKDNCNSRGVCQGAPDGNPVGNCQCDSGFEGKSCEIQLPKVLLSGVLAYILYILLGIGLVQCITWSMWLTLKVQTPLFVASTPSLMALMLAGGFISNIGSVVKMAEVTETRFTSTIPCGLSSSLMNVGGTTTLAALVSKCIRVSKIFDKKNTFSQQVIPTSQLLKLVAAFVVFQLIIASIRLLADAPERVQSLEAATGAIIVKCTSAWGEAWKFIEVIPSFLLLIKCVELSMVIRNLPAVFNENKVSGPDPGSFIIFFCATNLSKYLSLLLNIIIN
jgi:hypothetical protein